MTEAEAEAGAAALLSISEDSDHVRPLRICAGPAPCMPRCSCVENLMPVARAVIQAAASARPPEPGADQAAEVERLTRERDEAQHEVAIAKAQRDEARDSSVRFRRSADDSKKQNGAVYRRLNAMEGELRDERERAAAAETRAEKAERERDEARAKVERLERTAAEKEWVYNEQGDRLAAAEARTAALRKERDRLRAAKAHQTREREKHGVRLAITWLHREAVAMADRKATAILNSAAFHLGVDLARGDTATALRGDGAGATSDPVCQDRATDCVAADPGAARAREAETWPIHTVALYFDAEFGRPKRNIVVGTAGEAERILYVYAERKRDLDGLPDSYKGCEVRKSVVGNVRALGDPS